MTPQDKQAILAELDRGWRELLDSLSGLSEDAAAQRPEPGKWSAAECVEHIAIAEEYMLSLFAGARVSETAVGSPEREARIPVFGVMRARKMEAPEAARPTGRFATLAQALAGFAAVRERTIGAIDDSRDDLRAKTVIHPLAGQVNCHELLLVIAVHTRRHTLQIAEIRAAIGK